MTTPTPGACIGRYALIQLLGRGGMGEVWEAELQGPAGFRKPVALKVLSEGPRSDAHRDALLHEARLGALLHHPNVVSVHALEEVDGVWVVAMELVRGVSVHRLLCDGPLPARALLDVGIQVCAGLHHVHSLQAGGRPAGIVHRDIKPANLLVETTGLVKVADLGIASAAGTGSVMGTPGYIAPEQLEGRVDARSDLFALGATLYLCATGLHPFGLGHAGLTEVRRAGKRLADPAFLEPVEAAVPGLAAVLRECLAPDPSQRFASAAQLGAALSSLRAAQAGAGLLELLALARPDLQLSSATPPPPPSRGRTVSLTRSNLPVSRDAFVGRREQVDSLIQAIRKGPCFLTILGPGGIGKTRLALEAARRLEGVLAGGVWFFDLCEARSVAGICATVSRTLDLELDASDPVVQIGYALRGRGGACFVFDNLEQCADHVPDTIGRWVGMAGEARMLCTSRILLTVRGEQVVRPGPLSMDEAAELFLLRSPAEIPASQLDDVRELVEEVSCLPLSVELAAARTRLMPVPQLRERLGLRLLAGGGRHLPERQRSLQASLSWSWDLLPAHGREAMGQLSVFEGGFELGAAEAVLDLNPEAGWALDVLQELVDASLVRVEPTTGRFSMLLAVQTFAAEQLDRRPTVESRHGAWFSQPDSDDAADLDNVVVACRRAVGRRDAAIAARCALRAWDILRQQGPFATGAELLQQALACDPDPQLRLELLVAEADALSAAGSIEDATDKVMVAVGEARAVGGRRWEGVALGRLGRLLYQQGRTSEGQADLEAAIAIHREVGNRRDEAIALVHLGELTLELGRNDTATQQLEDALAIVRSIGHRESEGLVLHQLGRLYSHLGRPHEAFEHFRRALTLHRALGHRRHEAQSLGSLGGTLQSLGKLDQAQRHYEEALAVNRRLGSRREEGGVLTCLGGVFGLQGRLDDALRMMQQGLQAARDTGNRRGEGHVLSSIAIVHRLQGRMDEARQGLEQALAIEREVEARVAEGQILGHLAVIHALTGRSDDALHSFLEALEVHRALGARRSEGLVLSNLGDFMRDHGRLDEALSYYQAALSILEEVGAKRQEAFARTMLAELLFQQGEPDEARQQLEVALPMQEEVGEARSLVVSHNLFVMLELERGAPEAARAHSVRSLELARSYGDPHTLAATLQRLARVERSVGDFEAARLALVEAEALLRGAEVERALVACLCERALLELQAVGPDDAEGPLTQAADLVRKLGLRPEDHLTERVGEVRAAVRA